MSTSSVEKTPLLRLSHVSFHNRTKSFSDTESSLAMCDSINSNSVRRRFSTSVPKRSNMTALHFICINYCSIVYLLVSRAYSTSYWIDGPASTFVGIDLPILLMRKTASGGKAHRFGRRLSSEDFDSVPLGLHARPASFEALAVLEG